MDNFWTYYAMVIAGVVPWLSVLSPLVSILFIERYRTFVAGLFWRNLNRVGVVNTSNQMVPPAETGIRTPPYNNINERRVRQV